MSDNESIVRRVIREELESVFARLRPAGPPRPSRSPVIVPPPPPLPQHPPRTPPDCWLSVDMALETARSVGIDHSETSADKISQVCEDGVLVGH